MTHQIETFELAMLVLGKQGDCIEAKKCTTNRVHFLFGVRETIYEEDGDANIQQWHVKDFIATFDQQTWEVSDIGNLSLPHPHPLFQPALLLPVPQSVG